MKFSTLSIFFTVFVVCTAQTQDLAPLTFSPKMGINFNDFIIEETSEPVLSLARMGWNLGMDVSYGHRLQAQGGLHFFKLGNGFEMIKNAEKVTEKVSTSQFKIPIGVSYQVWNVEYFNLWLRSQLVMNLTTKMEQGYLGANDTYPRSSLGGRFGIGMDLGRFIMEVNYERSFTEMLHQTFNARAQLINVAVGVKI